MGAFKEHLMDTCDRFHLDYEFDRHDVYVAACALGEAMADEPDPAEPWRLGEFAMRVARYLQRGKRQRTIRWLERWIERRELEVTYKRVLNAVVRTDSFLHAN